MSPEKFEALTYHQQISLLLAMHIRNELEDFHIAHVSDSDMPELNCSIRYAIFDFFENVANSTAQLPWLAMMIPDYWEIPGTDPKPDFCTE